jgi:hypothetical protein
MAITYSLDHVVSTTESVLVEVAEKTDMVLQGTTTDPKTSESVSTYVIATGDNSHPATVTYRNGIQNRSGGQIRRVSVTFSTWARSSDSVTGAVVVKPITATVSFNIPADMVIETADFDDFIGNIFSLLYLSVTAGARDVTWIAKLLYGVPQVK